MRTIKQFSQILLIIVFLSSCKSLINKESPIKDMEEKHTYLNEKCPRLLKMAVQDRFEMDKLIYMLHMLRQVQSNKMTEKQASTVIGQKYADEYVTPLVDNLKKNK